MGGARILLADDHELFRRGLIGLINAQPDMQVVGEAGDGFEAISQARSLRPDLVIMDINMPVCDGLEATRRFRAAQDLRDTRILILTIHDEDDMLFEAIKAGANGYLLKSMASADFLRGVRGALAGEASLPPKMAAALVQEFGRLARQPAPPAEDVPDLTPRELEVLSLIAAGATDKEIGAQLTLSLYTVKSHVRNILSKLHAANRRQAARWAAQRGLLGDN